MWDKNDNNEIQYTEEREYGKEVNPYKVEVLCKKYLDDDTKDADLQITIIKDKETGKEFMIFDSAAGLVVKERNY